MAVAGDAAISGAAAGVHLALELTVAAVLAVVQMEEDLPAWTEQRPAHSGAAPELKSHPSRALAPAQQP